ncbi:DNA polymerase/3'-5' exonuclease PolX [Candidatus Thorarchaeota archaeon]|nr:MAG: DNA polymerase/3'-5' exonuclease PolX [Candidatus Thorarchaeota archaeon]
MTKNADVAQALKEISLLLEVEGENPYRLRAYSKAVRSISSLGEDIEAIASRDELTNIPGIGTGIAAKIEEYLRTGTIDMLDDLRARTPVDVLELDAIPGVGPKTIKLVYDELGVNDLESLEEAALSGKIATLRGMGEKSQTQILEGIELVKAGIGRTLLAEAMPHAETIREKLLKHSDVNRAVITGSYRRRRETVRDIDILVDASSAEAVMNLFVSMNNVMDIIAQGETKSSIRLENNLQVDLRVVPSESFGAGLQYFTGSVDHNVHLRSKAIKMGLLLNEYGLFKDDERIAGNDEEDVYAALGLPWIPPELREDRGEIEAAQSNSLPILIETDDIRGDLHSHTDQSDGSNTIEEMLDAADSLGYEYYCVSDHTQSLTIANGMDEDRLLKRIEEIDELNSSGRWNLKILKGAEVDILADGILDIEDDVLAQLDIVTVSVHSRMKDTKEVMTARVCEAIKNKHVHILGHPTGRLLLKRSEFEIDLEQVFAVAKKHNVAMELNAHPWRLDLDAGNLRAAKREGLKIAINTDAHKIPELHYMKYGIYQARRGWLTKEDVLNTYPLDDLLVALQK